MLLMLPPRKVRRICAGFMRIASWDLGRKFGWCFGESGKTPTSGSLVLRKPGEPNGLALGVLARFLRDHVRTNGKDDLWVCEHWLPPRQQKSADNVEDSLRMNGVVNGIAGVYGIELVEPYPAPVRSQVCGRPHAPGESKRKGAKMSNTKWLVIDTMVLRGFLPRGCEDDDRADSACAWCWAESNFARRDSSFTLTAR